MAKKGKKHQSVSQKQQFLSYKAENRQERNKICAIERHVKEHPEDCLAVDNLKRIKSVGQTWKRRVNRNSTFVPKRTRDQAKIHRANTTGAVTLNAEGKKVPKPYPLNKRNKKSTALEVAFNISGVKKL
ncbi:MAG: hypothetical protein GY810_00925 [Aureispira sp.]|nr:hypothetical protein [Aureispira sp.]